MEIAHCIHYIHHHKFHHIGLSIGKKLTWKGFIWGIEERQWRINGAELKCRLTIRTISDAWDKQVTDNKKNSVFFFGGVVRREVIKWVDIGEY